LIECRQALREMRDCHNGIGHLAERANGLVPTKVISDTVSAGAAHKRRSGLISGNMVLRWQAGALAVRCRGQSNGLRSPWCANLFDKSL
jgi:hypothetical protein